MKVWSDCARGARRAAQLGALAFAIIALGTVAPGSLVAAPVPAPLEVAGKVTIIRDRWGMAHLYAAREADGFYGLGYATAQDRLEQVLFFYLAARGELAAKFGPGPVGADKVGPALAGRIPDAVGFDRLVRQYRYLESARANLARLPIQYRRDLEAYVSGFNRYMVDHPERRPAWAPVLEPALPLAVVSVLLHEDAQVCPAKIAAAAAAAPKGGPVGAQGSNGWVVGPSRTADGGVILGSDSHGDWNTLGTLFYAWRMKAGDIDFQAFEPPGTARFFFGHSPSFAWGWTEGSRYPGDCYRIRTEPGDPTAYQVDGQQRRMVQIPYSIEVRGSAPATGVFDYVRQNGVLSPVVTRVGADAFAVSSVGLEDVGLDQGELYNMARAKTFTELKQALSAMQLYPANLIVGGHDGTLLYIRGGRIPLRPAGLNLDLPLDGNTRRTEWTGLTSFDQSAHLVNPAQQYIVNDNTSPDMMYPEPVLKASDYPQSAAFDPGQITSRQVRNMELLAHARGLTDQDAIRIAMDEKVPGFEHWAAVFETIQREGLWPHPDASQAAFLTGLRGFDGVIARDSTPALYFSAFFDALQKAHGEALHDLVLAVTSGRPLTAAQEGWVAEAALAAHDSLMSAFGRIDLTYGDVHRLAVGRQSWPVGGGSFHIGGDRLSLAQDGGWEHDSEVLAPMRAMAFRPDPADPRRVDWYCCQRAPFVVAFHPGRPLGSYSQLLPGVSMDPTSPHFDDQLRLASEGVMRSDDFQLSDLLNDAESSLVLEVR
ncbi:MAG TPA: penicillin acylase family protein [Caulobacteraceae bacterium]|nr:penicillin acylase family protein [Caulobacteraceae bacterium]